MWRVTLYKYSVFNHQLFTVQNDNGVEIKKLVPTEKQSYMKDMSLQSLLHEQVMLQYRQNSMILSTFK